MPKSDTSGCHSVAVNSLSREPVPASKNLPVAGKGSSNYPWACAVSNLLNLVGIDCCKETPSVKSAKLSYSC